MMKFLSLMLLILAVSCSPYPQDGKATAVLISVSLTYEGSPEYVNRLLCTANDSRAVEEEMKLLSEASGMDFELHKFAESGNGAGLPPVRGAGGMDSSYAFSRMQRPLHRTAV